MGESMGSVGTAADVAGRDEAAQAKAATTGHASQEIVRMLRNGIEHSNCVEETIFLS